MMGAVNPGSASASHAPGVFCFRAGNSAELTRRASSSSGDADPQVLYPGEARIRAARSSSPRRIDPCLSLSSATQPPRSGRTRRQASWSLVGDRSSSGRARSGYRHVSSGIPQRASLMGQEPGDCRGAAIASVITTVSRTLARLKGICRCVCINSRCY